MGTRNDCVNEFFSQNLYAVRDTENHEIHTQCNIEMRPLESPGFVSGPPWAGDQFNLTLYYVKICSLSQIG